MKLARRLELNNAYRGYSPGILFASGEQGAWFDPSDLSTMFQDSAGTTPVTAVDQPVGRILDKSGRNNHASQATAAQRPMLRRSANGLYYLQFDGVDDVLIGTVAGSTLPVTASQSVAFDASGIAVNSYGACGNDGGIGLGRNSSNQTILRWGTGAALGTLVTNTSPPTGTACVLTATSNGTSLSAQRDNGTVSTTTSTNPAGIGAFAIGAFRGGSAERMNGRLYSHIHIARVLTGSELSTLRLYMASKAGVTL